MAAGVAVAIGASACGGSGPAGRAVAAAAGGHRAGGYPVKVAAAFPASQRLAHQAELKIAVRNTGAKALPDVSVTLENPGDGTAAQALSTLISAKQPAGRQPVASRSRPVWMINREPGACGYGCQGGGPGGAVSSDAGTWALGRLAPGHAARFDWQLTAVRAGSYAVAYRVSAGTGTGSRAVLAGGAAAAGSLKVRIAGAPAQQRFTPSGKVVPVSGREPR